MNGKRKTNKEFIADARKIHGDKYDYSKVEYKNNKTKIVITCPIHGDFLQSPNSHLKGRGCKKCGIERTVLKEKSTKEKFIEKSIKIHGDKYDYSKVNYINNKTKVCIICPEHGEFWQVPNNHLTGYGCERCGVEIKRMKTLEFIEKANIIHKNKYDYSKTNIETRKNKNDKVIIICPYHGEFLQTLHSHLDGIGCPHCNSSHMEREVSELLTDNNIIFEYQKKFDWLGLKSLDFYLPYYNTAIECQGKQHFESINFFGGEYGLDTMKKRDSDKMKLCKKHKINIIYYANYEYNFPYEVITDKEILIKEIKKGDI